jgi:hypothetical protein
MKDDENSNEDCFTDYGGFPENPWHSGDLGDERIVSSGNEGDIYSNEGEGNKYSRWIIANDDDGDDHD